MKHLELSVALAGLLALGACSDSKDAIAALSSQDEIDTIKDCFPDLYEKVDGLSVVAQLWRLNTASNPSNPPGLTHSIQGDGSVQVDYTIPATPCSFSMRIRFYDPTGTEQNLGLTPSAKLSDIIDEAAGLIAVALPPDPFMVGTWTYTDASGGSGGGSLTGMIDGLANSNELELLITTEAMPSGGRPADAGSNITLMNAGMTCSVDFATVAPFHLQTDTAISQNYPNGQLSMFITGPKASVGALMTFNDTVIATIGVNGVPGIFEIDLETFSVTYKP